MYRLLVVCSLALLAGAAPQFQGDPSTAAILADTRQLRPDGSSDVAYAQEDGVLFKETTSGDGERRGSYEYVGDDGKLFRVEYTAGAGGFQVVSSTHVDKTPGLPAGPEEKEYEPAPRPAGRPAGRRTNGPSSFSVNYGGNQPSATAVTYATSPTPKRTTTTTTRRPVRNNFHNGKVTLDRDSDGYSYSYTKTR